MANHEAFSRPQGGPWRRLLDRIFCITLGSLLKWAFLLAVGALVLGVIGFVLLVEYPAHNVPSYEKVDSYAYLDQGWGTTADTVDRQTYYYTPQGTSMPQGA